MRRVVLIGFMGAGKTTVGRALASRLHWDFCDLDEVIEQREDQSVAQIFAARGEAGFRRIEAATLRDLLQDKPVQDKPVQDKPAAGDLVLALGGGAFVQAENR